MRLAGIAPKSAGSERSLEKLAYRLEAKPPVIEHLPSLLCEKPIKRFFQLSFFLLSLVYFLANHLFHIIQLYHLCSVNVRKSAFKMGVSYATICRAICSLQDICAVHGCLRPQASLPSTHARAGALFLLPFLSPQFLSLSLAFVGGIMVFISFDELLPLCFENRGRSHASILGIILGMMAMAISLHLL